MLKLHDRLRKPIEDESHLHALLLKELWRWYVREHAMQQAVVRKLLGARMSAPILRSDRHALVDIFRASRDLLRPTGHIAVYCYKRSPEGHVGELP